MAARHLKLHRGAGPARTTWRRSVEGPLRAPGAGRAKRSSLDALASVCQDFWVEPDNSVQPAVISSGVGLAPPTDPSGSPATVAGTATLRPPRLLVSKRAIGYWTLRAVPPWLVVAAIEIIWWINDTGSTRAHLIGLIATVIVAAAHLSVMPRWRYRVHRWETTPQAVYTQSGWFNQERRIAPISRIQTVDSHRGPFEQVFRLSNVTVTTASAAGPLRIHGLDRTVAQALVDELTSITAATEGDAT